MRERATVVTDAVGSRGGRPRAVIVWGLPAIFWTLFGGFMAIHTYLSMLTHGHSFARILFFYVAVCLFWVPATPAIAFLARRFSLVPFRWGSTALHLLAALVLASASVAWHIRMLLSVQPFDEMTITSFGPHYLHALWKWFPFELLIYCGTVGIVYAFEFYEHSQQRALRSAELEREVAQARLDALSLQLQPHFLFNALHTVTGLIRGEEDQAAISTVAGLSDMLRYALDSSAAPEVRLSEEIEIVKRYLAIERLRYQDRLQVTLDVETGSMAARVPRLLLQPLVENAVRHGAAANAGASWLEIKTRRTGDSLLIEVSNSAGGEAESERGFGIGLQNTRARLDHLYGSAHKLAIRRLPDRFELSLTIPWQETVAERRGDD
jgi:two-component system, LytTR family, sensor kinase